MASLIGRIMSSLPKTPFFSPTNSITCRFGAQNPHFQPKITPPPPPPPPMTCKFIPPPTNSFYKGAKRSWFLMACGGTVGYYVYALKVEEDPLTIELMAKVAENVFFSKWKIKERVDLTNDILYSIIEEMDTQHSEDQAMLKENQALLKTPFLTPKITTSSVQPPPPPLCNFTPPPTSSFNRFCKGAKKTWFLMTCGGTVGDFGLQLILLGLKRRET